MDKQRWACVAQCWELLQKENVHAEWEEELSMSIGRNTLKKTHHQFRHPKPAAILSIRLSQSWDLIY